jgi:predicted RNA binding protein YcfA (HicA-like mRNA interferase family)
MGEKYPILRPYDIISALAKKGFVFKSQKGSHAKYTNGHRTIVIPMHDTVARGTLAAKLQIPATCA